MPFATSTPHMLTRQTETSPLDSVNHRWSACTLARTSSARRYPASFLKCLATAVGIVQVASGDLNHVPAIVTKPATNPAVVLPCRKHFRAGAR